jgi:hypothetical protein
MPGCRTPTPSHGGARPQAANSTVGDLMRFAQALGSGTLISRAALAEAISQQQDEYGYGFTVGREPVPNYGHGGGAPAMNGDLRVFPSSATSSSSSATTAPSGFQPRPLLHAPNARRIVRPACPRARHEDKAHLSLACSIRDDRHTSRWSRRSPADAHTGSYTLTRRGRGSTELPLPRHHTERATERHRRDGHHRARNGASGARQ